MYCPKCGVQNIEDAKFCRGCGADIALVPQAMTGHPLESRDAGYDMESTSYDVYGRHRHRGKGPPRLDKAITNCFMGLGFVFIALCSLLFAPAGKIWWFWMLIPAFSLFGGGVAEYVRYKQSRGEEVKLPGSGSKKAMSPPARVSALPPRNTSELIPQPPSITENTTRHLDLSTEAPTRHIGVPVEKPGKDV